MPSLFSRWLLAGLPLFFAACHSASDVRQPTAPVGADTIALRVRIERLDSAFFATKTPADMAAFLAKNAAVRAAYFPPAEFNSEAELAEALSELTRNAGLRQFWVENQKKIGALQGLQVQFAEAFRNLRAYYPAFRQPRVVAMFTGFTGPDLYVSDSLIVIGLDYFAGPAARYRPRLAAYQLRKYAPEYLVPQAVLLLSGKYNETNRADASLLAEMLYFGKSFEFVKNILPATPDSLIIAYSGEQLAANDVAQDLIWGHFIDEKLLYETSPRRKERYLGERPLTLEIGPKCPGRIGQWLGWQILRKYREQHPEVPLPQVMKLTDARQVLDESRYRGQVEQVEEK